MTALHDIVTTSARVASTSARLEKIAEIAACLTRLEADEIATVVGLLTGSPRQARTGVGYASVRDIAPKPAAAADIQVADVDAALERLAAIRGRDAQMRRGRVLWDLLARATADEQDFIKRLLVGELRQGALEGVMIEAIAGAAGVAADEVRRAVMLRGDLGTVARIALIEGSPALAASGLQLFRPLQPMLAQSAASIEDALSRLGRASLEWKLDGARVQVHRSGDDVRVFSRRLNDVTMAVPEVVETVRALPFTQAVLDGEVVAYRADGTPEPFQITMRRFGRRIDVERMRAEIPLTLSLFDCLHLDGDDLIDRPADARLAALAGALGPAVSRGLLVPRIVTDDTDAADAFFAAALAAGHEGVMAKAPDAVYEAGRRGAAWLKVKLAHTLDLVILAAEWGSGRRRGRLSNLHLGARDPEGGGFVMLGKTFKGMTDEVLAWQTERLQEIETSRDGHVVHVRPEMVVEVAFDGVQASPQYPGGMALRFARLKHHRPDKAAGNADTIDQVRAIHAAGGGSG